MRVELNRNVDSINKLLVVLVLACGQIVSCTLYTPSNLYPRYLANVYSEKGVENICVDKIPDVYESFKEGWGDYWGLAPGILDEELLVLYIQKDLALAGFSVQEVSDQCPSDLLTLNCHIADNKGERKFRPIIGLKWTVSLILECGLMRNGSFYLERKYESSKSYSINKLFYTAGVDGVVAARATELLFQEIVYEVVADVVQSSKKMGSAARTPRGSDIVFLSE